MQAFNITNSEETYPWVVLTATSLGCLLVMINVVSLNVALQVITEYFHAGAATANWIVISGFVLFIFCMPLFIWIEKHTSSPMIAFELFNDRPYTMANIANFLNAFTRTSVVLLYALYFQVIFKDNTLNAGIKVLPMTIGLRTMLNSMGQVISTTMSLMIITASLS